MQTKTDMPLEHQIKTALAEDANIKLAFLFGSVSRGQARPSSDLDIAVAGNRPLCADEKMSLITRLAGLSGRSVDLIDLQSVGGPIFSEALLKGKLIYCLDRSLYAELIKRMLFEEADFMPYRRRILAERRRAWIGH
jgi:predicted nucleotidyltransferase